MRGSGKQKQLGMTLVELLVSMAVGVMLITGIIQLMASNKQHYQFQSELARIQENGRYALSVLRQELQMAGYAGCSASSQITNLLDTGDAAYSDTLFNLNQAVGGWEYTGSGVETAPGNTFLLSSSVSSVMSKWKDAGNSDLDSTLQNKVVKGTDVLVVKSTGAALDFTAGMATPITSGTTNFTVSDNLDAGQIVVISDCSGADLFRNCAPPPPPPPAPPPPPVIKRISCAALPPPLPAPGGNGPIPGNNTGIGLSRSYDLRQGNEDATIAPVLINSYYVGIGQNNTPTLYRKDYSKGAPEDAEALVEGVEMMQVLYGVDSDGDLVPNQYITAAGLGTVIGTGTYADNVVSVRISLLLRSIDEVEEVNNSDSLLMAETTINSGSDRYLRKTVSTTVQLRNRGI